MSPVVVLDSLLRSAFNLYFGMKNGELSVTPKKKNPKKPRKLYSLHNWFSRFKKSFG